MRKNVVFLADCLITQKAGIHYYAHQFIKRTISQYPDNQYFIVLPHPYEKLDAKEVIVPIKPYLPFHFRLRSFTSIPKVVKKLKADIVIEMAHFGPFNLPKNIKRITTIHDLTPITNPEWHNGLSHWIHRLFLPSILEHSNWIITNSKSTEKALHDYKAITTEKTIVVYPEMKPTLGQEEREKTKENNEENYLLAVGTIEPRKNYCTLIKAFAIALEKNPKLKLKIVGYTGWKTKKFFQTLKSLDCKSKIILEGYVSQEHLHKLFNNAHAFVFPSLGEGFGMPLIDALNYGLPIINSDIPTSREICAEAALYFEKTDFVSLANKINLISEDESLRRTLSMRARERSKLLQKRKFSIDKVLN